MNMKSILLFVSGLIAGGTAGVFGTKKYFENKYQKRYEEDHTQLEEYYHRRDEYTRISHDDNEEEEFEDDGINSPESDSRPGGRMTLEERAEIKKRLDKNWQGTTNYAGMYRTKDGYTEEKLAEGQHPLDQGEEGEEDPKYDENEECCARCARCTYDEENTSYYCSHLQEHVGASDSCCDFEPEYINNSSPEEDVFDEHQRDRNKPPRIISAEDYSNLPSHIEQEVLYFYVYDEQLCDDEEVPVEEPERLIGDALTKYNFVDSEERVIFVMNYALETCYEIQKLDLSWSDTH